MTTLNSEKYVEEAVRSIIDQTFKYFELIIVDGGSTDNTSYVVNSFQDSRIKFYVTAGGRGAQLNYGIRKSNSKYIAIMDSDDIAFPNRLHVQFDYMEKHPSTYILGSWAILISEDTGIIAVLKRPLKDKVIKENLLTRNGVSFPTLMINKEIFLGDMYFNESLKHSEDLEFFIRLPDKYHFSNVPEFLMQLRQTGNSRSRNADLCNKALLRLLESHLKQKIHTKSNQCLNNRHLGIAQYYYGNCKAARKYLFISVLGNPFKILTFRYLFPSFSGDKVLRKMRSNFYLRTLANLFRKISIKE